MPGPLQRTLIVRAGASTQRVRVVSGDVVEVDGRRIEVEVSPLEESTFVVTAGGTRHAVHVAVDGERVWAMAAGEVFEIEPDASDSAAGERFEGTATATAGGASSGSDEAALSAPMPATVAAVLVQPGERVAGGQALVRLEAMKMEIVLAAPRGGRVATVACREGDLVQPGHALVRLEDDPGL